MQDKSKVEEYLEKFFEVRPKKFFHRVDDSERGLAVILRMLDDATGEVNAGDIASELRMSTPRVAAALKTLERKGYAVRTPSAKDRRKTVVSITDVGRERVHELWREVCGIMEYLLDPVGEAELSEFIRLCGKINSALDERAEKE